MTMPEAMPNPCAECPFSRKSTPGWLGPLSGKQWVAAAHGEVAIACHMTIKDTDEEGNGDWSHPDIRQCRGAAIFRANVCKSPRDPEVAVGPADEERVFRWDDEFLSHHDSDLARFLEDERNDPTHVLCLEDDTYTLLDGAPADSIPCPVCEDLGRDPWCVQAVRISPCRNGAGCLDDDHHWGRGDHVKEVQSA